MYFYAAVVFFMKFSILFRMVLAILCIIISFNKVKVVDKFRENSKMSDATSERIWPYCELALHYSRAILGS